MLTIAASVALAAADVFVSPRHDPVGAHATAVFIEVADASAQMVLSADHRHQTRCGCGFTVGALDLVLSQQSNHGLKIRGVVNVGDKSGFLAARSFGRTLRRRMQRCKTSLRVNISRQLVAALETDDPQARQLSCRDFDHKPPVEDPFPKCAQSL